MMCNVRTNKGKRFLWQRMPMITLATGHSSLYLHCRGLYVLSNKAIDSANAGVGPMLLNYVHKESTATTVTPTAQRR
eukprot:6458259-Amphidinium_carterae.1